MPQTLHRTALNPKPRNVFAVKLCLASPEISETRLWLQTAAGPSTSQRNQKTANGKIFKLCLRGLSQRVLSSYIVESRVSKWTYDYGFGQYSPLRCLEPLGPPGCLALGFTVLGLGLTPCSLNPKTLNSTHSPHSENLFRGSLLWCRGCRCWEFRLQGSVAGIGAVGCRSYSNGFGKFRVCFGFTTVYSDRA